MLLTEAESSAATQLPVQSVISLLMMLTELPSFTVTAPLRLPHPLSKQLLITTAAWLFTTRKLFRSLPLNSQKSGGPLEHHIHILRGFY